jgi:predicted nucleotide-binding protein
MGSTELGLISDMKSSKYVDMDGVPTPSIPLDDFAVDESEGDPGIGETTFEAIEPALSKSIQPTTKNNRVFITHGKNLGIVNQLKELLTFGSFVPVVAAEHETISKPISDKVMDDMRSCSAAIIHVGKEIKLLDQEGREHIFLNQNVLIEIGGAMALYGRKFILLVERGG